MASLLSFMGGAACGLGMSSALWFGATVLLVAVSNPAVGDTEMPSARSRAAIGGALMFLGLAPVLFMIREESWTALHGYITAVIAMPCLVLIQMARNTR